MKTAKFLKKLEGWLGDAALYELSELASYEAIDKPGKTKYVIVSAVDNDFGIETYIFPSDIAGVPFSMLEMEGSFKGEMNHEKALEYAGYKLLREEKKDEH